MEVRGTEDPGMLLRGTMFIVEMLDRSGRDENSLDMSIERLMATCWRRFETNGGGTLENLLDIIGQELKGHLE
ncbi:MAG: hypothetical protein CMJ83_20675 [Planctomycetes bacterium]|nr:hypothetical protein [Planctomycetota bacterium]